MFLRPPPDFSGTKNNSPCLRRTNKQTNNSGNNSSGFLDSPLSLSLPPPLPLPLPCCLQISTAGLPVQDQETYGTDTTYYLKDDDASTVARVGTKPSAG